MPNGGIISSVVLPEQSVLFGQTEIAYSVNVSDRKTLAIHVYPDGQVAVDAPLNASHEAIAEKVKKTRFVDI